MLSWFHNFEPSSVLWSFGIWQIHWYGLLFGLAALIAFLFIIKSFKLHYPDLDFTTLYFELLIVGLVGARLFDVIFYEWWYFQNNLLDILKVWQGGLAWQGGLLFGAAYLYGYCRVKNISLLHFLDLIVPGLAIGQAIGRLGNYFNQELFGLPTTLPWGIKISSINRPIEYSSFEYFQPVFLYELLALLLLAIILKSLNKKNTVGLATAWYLIATGAVRFMLELIRLDNQNIYFGIRAGLILAAVTIIIGIIYHLLTCRIKADNNS